MQTKCDTAWASWRPTGIVTHNGHVHSAAFRLLNQWSQRNGLHPAP